MTLANHFEQIVIELYAPLIYFLLDKIVLFLDGVSYRDSNLIKYDHRYFSFQSKESLALVAERSEESVCHPVFSICYLKL